MSLNETLVLLAAGVLLSAFCLWHQRRPRGLGEVSLFPSTLLLGAGLLAMILALAHLVTLWTGHAPGRQLW
ncbi:MAG: hypothetical protein U1E14_18475 [Geminicoccaceae bacterium]